MKSFLYYILDKFIMTDFTSVIAEKLNKYEKLDYVIVFDVGCYIGNFSRNLKKKLNKNTKFHLFDANPELKIIDFNYEKIAISDKTGTQNFFINNFLPHSGSSLNDIHVKDKWWNLTRKIVSGGMKKNFTSIKVKTETLDNYCQLNGIKNIDVLKIDTEGSELNVLNGANDILKTVKILALEILDETSKFDDKRSKIYKILKDRYGFNLISEKKMWSLGTFSKMKAVDALFEKK